MGADFRRTVELVEDSFLELGRQSGSEEIIIPGAIALRDRELRSTGGEFNIVARIDVEERKLAQTLRTITGLFDPFGLPVSIGVPPNARPRGLASRLHRSGFSFSEDVSVMVLGGAPRPGSTSKAVNVREIGRDEPWRPLLGSFCDLLFQVFATKPDERPRRRQRIFHNFQRTRSRYFLAELDGRFVGTTILHNLRGVANVSAVGTAAGYRRRGVARAMMARALSDARSLGPKAMWLATERGSVAEPLYRDLGFVRLFVLPVFRHAPPQ